MKPERIFKRYDVRGRYPEELDEEFARALGKSIGSFAARNYSKQIVVSRDTKSSSISLKESLIEGIQSTGVDVIDVGEGPTDYVAFAGKEKNSVSVQVTSSHMPLDFNGFKFMYPEGNGFKNPDLDEVKRIFREKDFETGKGNIEEEILREDYIEEAARYLSHFNLEFDKEIVIDDLKGSSMVKELLDYMDIEYSAIEREDIPNPPNPTPENLKELEENTVEIGIANDLDADRVTFYYKDRFLTGNDVIGILSQVIGGDIVASIDTSESLKKVVDGEIFFTRVGDPFVMDRALKEDVKFAAEPNGHYAFLDFVPYSSGTVTAVFLAGLNIEQLIDNLPDVESRRKSIEVDNKEKAMQKIADIASNYDLISDIDGYKVSDGKSVVLARASGSSQKIRLVAESQSGDFSLMNTLAEILPKC